MVAHVDIFVFLSDNHVSTISQRLCCCCCCFAVYKFLVVASKIYGCRTILADLRDPRCAPFGGRCWISRHSRHCRFKHVFRFVAMLGFTRSRAVFLSASSGCCLLFCFFPTGHQRRRGNRSSADRFGSRMPRSPRIRTCHRKYEEGGAPRAPRDPGRIAQNKERNTEGVVGVLSPPPFFSQIS